ncbi:MAG: 2Fe-2S ferredoxin, partial [Verrucomicrobiota bacterium]
MTAPIPDRLVADVETPAWLYNESTILGNLEGIRELIDGLDVRLLFPLKCFTQRPALETMSPLLDGWAASSPFEARLARELATPEQTVQATSPCIRPDDVKSIAADSDLIACNSLHQLKQVEGTSASLGLRINPGLSFIDDERYDPCRPGSKLGVPLQQLPETGFDGFLVHTHCESETLLPLRQTLQHIDRERPDLLPRMKWINLGGGYLFNQAEDPDTFKRTIDDIRQRSEATLYIEPGWDVVGNAGCIVSSVVDLFDNEPHRVAVLDTSINHLPEVLEFDYSPEAKDAEDDAPHEYLLSGATCLAGDVFGAYRFHEAIEVGSRVVFLDCGAYSMVKA